MFHDCLLFFFFKSVNQNVFYLRRENKNLLGADILASFLFLLTGVTSFCEVDFSIL